MNETRKVRNDRACNRSFMESNLTMTDFGNKEIQDVDFMTVKDSFVILGEIKYDWKSSGGTAGGVKHLEMLMNMIDRPAFIICGTIPHNYYGEAKRNLSSCWNFLPENKFTGYMYNEAAATKCGNLVRKLSRTLDRDSLIADVYNDIYSYFGIQEPFKVTSASDAFSAFCVNNHA